MKDSNRISLQEIMDPCIQQTATCCFSMLFHSHPSIFGQNPSLKKGLLCFFLTNLTNTLKSEIRSMWEINFPFKVWHEWPSFLLRIRNISRFTLESHEAGVSISWDNAWCICFWLDEIRRKFIMTLIFRKILAIEGFKSSEIIKQCDAKIRCWQHLHAPSNYIPTNHFPWQILD